MPKASISPGNTSNNLSSRVRSGATANAWYNTRPLFEYVSYGNDPDVFRIRGFRNASGTRLMVLPFQVYDSTSGSVQTLYRQIDDIWTIDVNTTVISLSTFTGGLIDGSTLTASDHYLIWAFLDTMLPPGEQFRGIGITRAPLAAYTAVSGTSKGNNGTFTLAGTGNNDGRYFTVGARVLIRSGVAPGAEYNQGTITAVTQTSIAVDLDNSPAYGVNITIAAGTIIQIDSMSPRVAADDDVYGGYRYCYLGSIKLDTSSEIEYLRKPGDWIPTAVGLTQHVFTANNTDNGTFTRTLAQWMPVGAIQASLHVRILKSGGGTVNYGLGIGNTRPVRVNNVPSAQAAWNANRVYVDPTGAIYLEEVGNAGGATISRLVYFDGYKQENW